ncbi:DUF1573 domain-containing protein [Moheibacter stercoris]|uniref:DUF1573 domain-containing protein n=1 Tax=Moheibacter stercoris TaxID=1628251 RepID=A0ABV2LUW7_9FLAO
MKKLFMIGAFLIGGFSLSLAQEIELSESNVDLGNIAYGGKAVTTIQVKNTGTKPLVISKADASCGCTVPKVPKDPIMPGKSADMTIEYTTTTKPGAFNKTVTINSNAITEGRKIFRIKGVVADNPNAPKAAPAAASVKK